MVKRDSATQVRFTKDTIEAVLTFSINEPTGLSITASSGTIVVTNAPAIDVFLNVMAAVISEWAKTRIEWAADDAINDCDPDGSPEDAARAAGMTPEQWIASGGVRPADNVPF